MKREAARMLGVVDGKQFAASVPVASTLGWDLAAFHGGHRHGLIHAAFCDDAAAAYRSGFMAARKEA